MNTCLIRSLCILCLGVFLSFLFIHTSHAQSKDVVVEEIVARVNNDIVTISDLEKAQAALRQEISQDCQGCTQDKMDEEYNTRSKDVLRDLIDQDLLVQQAKDEGVSVETDLIKHLDDVRKENNLASIDDLEKAVESQGLSWEDYKSQIRNNLLTQEVIRRDVGSRIDIAESDARAYYAAHKQDYVKPEEVVLAEIFLSTQGKSPQEMAAVEMKADDLRARLVNGDDFNQLAKRYSEGSTAADGGELGTFQRGQLDKQIEDAVFKLDKGQFTSVIQTKTGFEILKVESHYVAGLQPYEKVQDEIMNRLYMQRVQPALRDYLGQLREQSYVKVRPGYVDSAAVPGTSVITEVSPTPDTQEKSKGKKKFPHPKVEGL
ncbi:MAG TPA: peptidylprolyl isomerase [Verrucomicrobiae bacterium]|nr:peptidylprolyl isomerase [Verrucomicrobiae bacterium]